MKIKLRVFYYYFYYPYNDAVEIKFLYNRCY